MSVELDELCEWCFEKGRERPANTMLAGVPLCSTCSTDTSPRRFQAKAQEDFVPESSASGPVRNIPVEREVEIKPLKPAEPQKVSQVEQSKCECGKESGHIGRCKKVGTNPPIQPRAGVPEAAPKTRPSREDEGRKMATEHTQEQAVEWWEQALIEKRLFLVDQLCDVLHALAACDEALRAIGRDVEKFQPSANHRSSGAGPG